MMCNTGEQIDHELAGWGSSIKVQVQNSKSHILTLQSLHHPRQMRDTASQPVEFAYNQRVTFPAKLQSVIQSLPVADGAGLLAEYLLHAYLAQFDQLGF